MERDRLVLPADSPLSSVGDDALDALAAALQVQDLAAGQVLLTEGEQATDGFLILDGQLLISSIRGGTEVELNRLGKGDPLGLLALIHDLPRSADARAVTDTRVARLSRTDYERLAAQHPRIAVALQLVLGSQLARDVRSLTNRVADVLADEALTGAAIHDYDVVVIGAGYVGLSYAMWVKKERPETRVVVVDKRDAPGFKIGESSLGPTIRNLVSLGIPMPVLRRLFHVKLELSSWWTGADSDEVGIRVSPGFFDESFQFERRVLETLMTNQARRLGVEVVEQTLAKVRESNVEGPVRQLLCEGPEGPKRLAYKVLCDASGPGAAVARALNLYTKRLDGLNTNAYFGYYRKLRDPDVQGWDNASTRHLCFPDGWVWFIELASWEKTPDDRLQAMIDHLLDLEGPDEAYPTRNALSEQFGCQVEELFSIGVVPRSDTDEAAKLPVEDRFQHYVDTYPGFKRIMDCYEVVRDVYPGHRTFRAFMRMSHDSERATGDGWLAVGDAAFFVNPLWSPGLAYGSGGSFIAAGDTVAALERGDFSRDAFARYQGHARAAFKQIFRENEMFYRAFAHPVSYERVGAWKFAMSGYAAITTMLTMMPPGVPRPPIDRPFPEQRLPTDPVFGAITFPLNIDTVAQVVDVMRRGEAAGQDPADTADEVKAIIDGVFKEIAGTEALEMTLMPRRMPHYNAALERVEEAERDPLAKIWRCPSCRHGWNQLANPMCHVCGERQPQDVVLER
jgi:flavin-dependent dehydrogenase